jgi:rubrerythrin
MNDLISRQQAIDAIHCDITVTGKQNAELVASTIGAFVDRIKALPSAQPERKKGKWIGKYPVTSVCSECNYLIHDSKVKAFAYCPNCGADMRGEQDD